jgi:hypothetical protein
MIYILEREPLLSLFLKAKKVIGVESVPDAIKDIKPMQCVTILITASSM